MQPLRREVETPRRAAGLWAPVMTLVSVTMATLIVGVAVTARPAEHPRQVPVPVPRTEPAQPVIAPVIAPVAVPEHCGQRIYRANPDGQAELYEVCVDQQRGRGVGSAGSDDGRIIRR